MNCKKCNKPMKEYLGLFEKGWDCVNPFCDSDAYARQLGMDAKEEEKSYKEISYDIFGNSIANDPGDPYKGVKFDTQSAFPTEEELAKQLEKRLMEAMSGFIGDTVAYEKLSDIEETLTKCVMEYFDSITPKTASPEDLENKISVKINMDESEDDFQFRVKAHLD